MTATTDPVRRAALEAVGASARLATDRRDAAIVAAVAAGMSQRDVARTVGLSHTAVQHIVRRSAHVAASRPIAGRRLPT